MTNPLLVLKNIEQLGRAYCHHHLDWDSEKMEDDWFESLKFFFAHSFARGRRDELSNDYYSFTIDRLQHDILDFKDREDTYRRLQERANEFDKEFLLSFKRRHRLGKQNAIKHGHFVEEIAARNEVIRLLTTQKTVKVTWEDHTDTKNIRLANDEDVLMVLDTLRFISAEERRNIYTYLRAVIQNRGVRTAYDELTKLRAVKDKIATFVIRDIGLMNLGLIKDGFESAFPVDTWVKRLAAKIGCAATSDVGIKKYFIDKCRQASLDPLLVAAGLWYLGYHSLEILLEHYLGEYDIVNSGSKFEKSGHLGFRAEQNALPNQPHD